MDLTNILFAKALNKGDATKEYVDEAIKALKGEVNADLDTLEELSKALGNDPDFFLSVKNELDKKITQEELDSAIANLVSISNYNPIDKTDSMTQPIGKDADGKLWTAPTEQSDWNENDETSPAFVKNRPFYDKSLVSVPNPQNTRMAWYKVSDDVPTGHPAVNDEACIIANGSKVNGSIVLSNDEYYVASELMVVVALKDNVVFSEFNNLTFPEKGTYFIAGEGLPSITGFALGKDADPEITWDGNTGEIKQIDTKYIPDDAFPQSDWDEQDESKSSFIRNKPMFLGKETSISIAEGDYSVMVGTSSISYTGTTNFKSGHYYLIVGDIYVAPDGFVLIHDAFKNSINMLVRCETDNVIPFNFIAKKTSASGYGTVEFRKIYDGLSTSFTNRIEVTYVNGTGTMGLFGIKGDLAITEIKQIDERLIPDSIQRVGGDIILSSTTADSTKQFRITVDDSGKPTFTNTSDSANAWTPTDELPTVTTEDAGKFLRVSSTGEWTAESISNAEEASF